MIFYFQKNKYSLEIEIAETYGKYLGKGLTAIVDVCNHTTKVVYHN